MFLQSLQWKVMEYMAPNRRKCGNVLIAGWQVESI